MTDTNLLVAVIIGIYRATWDKSSTCQAATIMYLGEAAL